jgi:hypothetical protein
MQALKADLEKVATNVSVEMGTGGWEGGEEPTHVTTFTDGPQAMSVLAKYAKTHNQDAAIVMKAARKGDPGAAPQQRLKFQRPLDAPAMRVVESQLVANGIGGWTWANDGGKSTLIVQTIPVWGGDAQNDLAAVQGLRAAMQGLGVQTSYNQAYTTIDILERGEYDEHIID